jgi:hypothetical protein
MSLQGQKLKRTKQKDTFRTCFQSLLLKFNLADKHDGFLWFRMPILLNLVYRRLNEIYLHSGVSGA